jgi:Sec-independent protein secretion pathway component TatC
MLCMNHEESFWTRPRKYLPDARIYALFVAFLLAALITAGWFSIAFILVTVTLGALFTVVLQLSRPKDSR